MSGSGPIDFAMTRELHKDIRFDVGLREGEDEVYGLCVPTENKGQDEDEADSGPRDNW